MGTNLVITKQKSISVKPLLILSSIVVAIPVGLVIRNSLQLPIDSINYRVFQRVYIFLTAMGKLYLNFLEMVIYPIVITSIITSLAGLLKSKYISEFIRRIILIYTALFLLISILGVFSGVIFKIGSGIQSEHLEVMGKLVQDEKDIEVSLSTPHTRTGNNQFFYYLINLFPDNIFSALVDDLKFQIVIASILMGVAISMLVGKQRDYIISLSTNIMNAFQEIIRWVLYFLPFGIFCLLTTQLTTVGTGILLSMTKFILVFILMAFILIVFNTMIIWRRSKKKLFFVIKSLMEPILVALFSRNSFVTLPIAVETLSKKFNFFEKSSNLIMPFGITIGRFGNILYFSMVAVFAQHFYGFELTMYRMAIIVISSILAGVASAGTTGPAAVGVLAFVLIPLGIPTEVIIPLFIAIDIIADPIRTLLITHTNIAATSLIIETYSPDGDRRMGSKSIKPIMTLRASVVVLIIASIALSGITTFIVAYEGSRKSVHYVAESMMDEMASSIADKTTGYMHSAEVLIRELKYMLENNFNLNKGSRLTDLIRQLLAINKEIGAIYLGRPDGSFTMVKRMLDGSISYRIIKRNNRTVHIDWIHDNESYTDIFPDEILPVNEGYDPRARSWYKLALEKDDLVWQDVYVFSSDHIPGITCAMPVRIGNDLIGVLGADIGVAEFSFFLGELSVSETGVAVLMNNKEELIAVSTDKTANQGKFDKFIQSNKDNNKLELIPVEKSDNEVIRNSYLAYQSTKNIQQLPVFYVGEDSYATYYKKFSPNDYFNWSMGIVIPETILMEQVNRNNIIVITMGSIFILVSLLIGLRFSKSISRPLKLLSYEMEKVQHFSLNDINDVPSYIREVNEMNSTFTNMVTGLKSFNKYVPSNLVTKLMTLGKEAVIGGEKKVLTLFFSDIKNFTTICEQYDHDHIVRELERYLNIMTKSILKNSGTVDKYMGDGIMAFWGAPDDVEDHAALACHTALECQKELRKKSSNIPESLFAQFYTRIGINTGEVIVGNMGSDERLDYTVIGDPANLASRLEALNKVYGTHIIISQSTYKLVKNRFETRLLDRVAVKGKSQGIYIYEVVCEKGVLDKASEQFLKGSNYGASLYFNKDWKGAASVYQKLLKMNGKDIPSQLMYERCRDYMDNPPPEDWDGVYVLKTK